MLSSDDLLTVLARSGGLVRFIDQAGTPMCRVMLQPEPKSREPVWAEHVMQPDDDPVKVVLRLLGEVLIKAEPDAEDQVC